jgi:altronate dehydratase
MSAASLTRTEEAPMAALQANSKHANIVVLGLGDDTYRLFQSYGVTVGMQKNNNLAIFTEEKFSVTTSRHIRKFMYEHGGQLVEQNYFRQQLDATGLKVKTERY